ncbi:hypothetical protein MAH1_31290 [Sessilibacter sp. MAH1]
MPKIFILFMAALISLCTGCASSIHPGGATPPGLLAKSVTSTAPLLSAPIDKDSQSNKSGESSAGSVLWLVGYGDSSVTKAMENGDISKIHHIDFKNESFLLGLFSKTTTIVYGE